MYTEETIRHAQAFAACIGEAFDSFPDPRVEGRSTHLLLDILVISLLANLCGAEDFSAIATVAEAKADFFAKFLQLPGGIPSHDTFRRVLGSLNRKTFSQCFHALTQRIAQATEGDILAIDGKALRRTGSKSKGLPPLHLVSAWSIKNHLTLGLVACEDKSNEITAIPQLLALLDLKGSLITIDAMGAQRTICEQIVEQKGHYCIAIKGNQPSLEQALEDLVAQELEEDLANIPHRLQDSESKGHGRQEHRRTTALSLSKWEHEVKPQWRSLASVVIVDSVRMLEGKETCSRRTYISDLPYDDPRLLEAPRLHWSIENAQHWVLDVQFGEDYQRQQDRNGAANLAALRRISLGLLRNEKSRALSIKNKRMICAMDEGYLIKVCKSAVFDA